MTDNERITAYLVIPMMSYYNDNWYEDYTLSWGAVNPDRLFKDAALAHKYMEQQTLRTMQSSKNSYRAAMSDKSEGLLSQLREFDKKKRTGMLGLLPSKNLTRWLDSPATHEQLPENISDAELLALTRALDIRFFYVFETDTSARELSEAVSILETTPERPQVIEEPVLIRNLNDPHHRPLASRPMPSTLSPDEAAIAARLERVTQLFGKRYATRLDY